MKKIPLPNDFARMINIVPSLGGLGFYVAYESKNQEIKSVFYSHGTLFKKSHYIEESLTIWERPK